jgi:pimeloyl-ACP methyl ester carboxylesterase
MPSLLNALVLLSFPGVFVRQDRALVLDPGPATPLLRGETTKTFRIESLALDETRTVHVVFPASFAASAPERRYPVAIVLDGEDNVPSAAAVASELARNGQIPELLLVAIPNVTSDPDRRVHDLTPPGLSVSGSSRNEGGERFLDFIEQELLPAVDAELRGAAPRAFIGHSSGGILATYAAATRPAFRAVIAIDTPTHLQDDWLAKKLIARAGASPPPLRYASYEARFGWREANWRALVAAAPPAWKLHREHLGSESHESLGLLAMYLGLREVFRDYSMLAAPLAPTTRILPYYTQVSADLGAPVIPPQRLLRNVVEDLCMEGRGADARAAYTVLASGFGAPSDAASLLAEIAEVEKRSPPTETVEGLLATPFPTPEEAKAFVGEWVGDSWRNADEPRTEREHLRLSVVDGELRGETSIQVPGETLVMPWTYLRITPGGLTWGYMNGMRPRGMILFEAQLTGDELHGSQRFGGIDFHRPDGSKPPTISFSFRRARG